MLTLYMIMRLLSLTTFHTNESMAANLYDQAWTPQMWEQHGVTGQDIIDGLYAAEIITDQDTDDTIPVLEVGDRFLSLSSQDQLRIIRFLDYMYGFTANNQNAVIYIEHCDYKGQIGLYTISGLNMI